MSSHFDGKTFTNPGGAAAGQPLPAVARMLRESRSAWPTHIEVEPRRPSGLDGAAAAITFIGHSTFLIQTPAGNVLTDPMYSERAGPWNLLGPRRVRQPAVRFEDLPPISTILVSHNHYDHCDLRTLGRLARRFNPPVVTPIGNARILRATGIRVIEELDWWEETAIGGVQFTLTPARHFSARTPFDRNRALWGGFGIGIPQARLYFAGDTAYDSFFADIRTRLGPIDLALLPIGAYEPRWFMQSLHMNPADAVQAHLDLDAAMSVGMHYGTFQLTTEGIDEPLRALDEACQARGVPRARFRTLEFGETFRMRPEALEQP